MAVRSHPSRKAVLALALAAAAACAGCTATSTGSGGSTASGTGGTAAAATGSADTSASASASAGTGTGTGTGPSQSAADAKRDGVAAAVAAIPLGTRLVPVQPLYPGVRTSVSTPDGEWVLSRPDLSAMLVNGCLPADAATAVRYRTCMDYSEALLLGPGRSRVLRAVPIPAAPAQWLVLGDGALYVGRQGDGGLPDSMVLRVGLADRSVLGRVFPGAGTVDPGVDAADLRSWPGRWTLNRPVEPGFDRATLSRGALVVGDPAGGHRLRLDPQTLEPLP